MVVLIAVGFRTKRVYLGYITCSRYAILIRNPRGGPVGEFKTIVVVVVLVVVVVDFNTTADMLVLCCYINVAVVVVAAAAAVVVAAAAAAAVSVEAYCSFLVQEKKSY